MITSSKINSFQNVSQGKDINILNNIHLDKVNISIYQRTIQHLEDEIIYFLSQGIELKAQGTPENIIETFKGKLLKKGVLHSNLLNDFSTILKAFEVTSGSRHFRVLFSNIETDMCRRFHTDMNELRLLSTYYGPGTLWLPEEAEDRNAYHYGEPNEQIIQNSELIQQANTGDVLILKGALYPNAKAVIHRSPSIQKKEQKRLLLRIDMTKPSKFIR